MKPSWLTISIVPALVAACVAFGIGETFFRASVQQPASEKTNTGSNSAIKVAASNQGGQTEAPAKPIKAADEKISDVDEKHLSNNKVDNVKEDVEPWWARVIDKVAWPVALLLALAFVAYNARLARIFGFGTRLIKKISAGGVEIEINSETVELVQRQLHDNFQELVGGAGDEYGRAAQIQDIPELLKNAINAVKASHVKDMRGTIHVNDVVFPEYLYQIVDYYPTGGGADRRFSLRYGIIGRTWRSKKSHGTGNAFSGAGGSVEALVENWGMTEEEAHGHLNGRPSCLSVLVRSQSVPVGILFIDSTQENAFGSDDAALELARNAEVLTAVSQLGDALARTLAPLRTAAPSLKISGPAK